MIKIELTDMEQSLLLVEEHIQALSPSLNPEQHYKAAFVCEEILTNLARHADFGNRKPDVFLKLERVEADRLVITFQDNAEPFDILAYPDLKMERNIEEAALGGLGIYLTKQYAKDIEYRYEKGYNILKILLS